MLYFWCRCIVETYDLFLFYRSLRRHSALIPFEQCSGTAMSPFAVELNSSCIMRWPRTALEEEYVLKVICLMSS